MKLYELLNQTMSMQIVEVILTEDETKSIRSDPISIRDMIMPSLNSGTVDEIAVMEDTLQVWVTPGELKKG